MYRLELTANHSVEENVLEALKDEGVAKYYTHYSGVFGVGRSGPRMGDAIWPEENFTLVIWCDADELQGIQKAISTVKQQFPEEGIKIFGFEVDDPILSKTARRKSLPPPKPEEPATVNSGKQQPHRKDKPRDRGDDRPIRMPPPPESTRSYSRDRNDRDRSGRGRNDRDERPQQREYYRDNYDDDDRYNRYPRRQDDYSRDRYQDRRNEAPDARRDRPGTARVRDYTPDASREPPVDRDRRDSRPRNDNYNRGSYDRTDYNRYGRGSDGYRDDDYYDRGRRRGR